MIEVELTLPGTSPPSRPFEPYWCMAGQRFSVRARVTTTDGRLGGKTARLVVEYGREPFGDEVVLAEKVGDSVELRTFPLTGPANDASVEVRVTVLVEGAMVYGPCRLFVMGYR